MSIIKFTNKGFDKNSSVSPDNYYLNECTMILDSIFKNIEYNLKEIVVKEEVMFGLHMNILRIK